MLISIVTLLLAGLMVGNEIAVGLFVHPQLAKLDDGTHTRAVQPLARVFGRVMPFWYAATLLASSGTAYMLWIDGRTAAFWYGVTAAILWAISIIYTLVGPAPINTRVAQWNLHALPADWKQQRQQWDRLHQFRLVILLGALVAQLVAVVSR